MKVGSLIRSEMSNSFLQYEKERNCMLHALRTSHDVEDLAKFIAKEDIVLLVPQNVSIETLCIDRVFIETHTVRRNPSDPTQFISLNGVRGVFAASLETIYVLAGPPGDDEIVQFLDDPLSFFGEGSVFENWNEVSTQHIEVLRDGEISLQESGKVEFYLIAEPIQFSDQPWTVSSKAVTKAASTPTKASVPLPAVVDAADASTPDDSSKKRPRGLSRFFGSKEKPKGSDSAEKAPKDAKETGDAGDKPKERDFLSKWWTDAVRWIPVSKQKEGTPSKSGDTEEEMIPAEDVVYDEEGHIIAKRVPVDASKEAGAKSSASVGSVSKEQSEPAVAPILTYRHFLETLKDPRAADVVDAVKQFVKSIRHHHREENARKAVQSSEKEASEDESMDDKKKPSLESLMAVEIAAEVHEFLDKLEADLRSHHVLWKDATDEELYNMEEGLEKLLMNKLHAWTFRTAEDSVKDLRFQREVLTLQFLKPEHFDLDPTIVEDYSWNLAQRELAKLNLWKSPRDKMVCIINCCKLILNVLSRHHKGSGTAGADEYIPAMIFMMLTVKVDHIHSNLAYIARYRRPALMSGESNYFHTNMLSAVSFIESLDPSRLSMGTGEFDRLKAEAAAALDTHSDREDDESSISEKSVEGEQEGSTMPPAEPTKSEDSITTGVAQVSLDELLGGSSSRPPVQPLQKLSEAAQVPSTASDLMSFNSPTTEKSTADLPVATTADAFFSGLANPSAGGQPSSSEHEVPSSLVRSEEVTAPYREFLESVRDVLDGDFESASVGDLRTLFAGCKTLLSKMDDAQDH